MSLNVALNIAASGLFANQNAVAATSENIANVNTVGFARREVGFTADAIPDQFSGVSAETVRAGVDRFLQASGFDARADAARAEVVAEALAQVEAALGAPGQNISFANDLDAAFAALTTLAANPTSTAAKADALARLDAAFANIGGALDAIDGASEAAFGRLQLEIDDANRLLENLFELNQIAPSSDGAADQLDVGLAELARYAPIVVARADDGRVTVTTTDGSLLLNGDGFARFAADAGPPTTVALSTVDASTGAASQVSADIAAALGAGSLGGLLALRNTELPALSSVVGEAARALAGDLNAVYTDNVAVGAAGAAGAALIVETNGRFAVDPSLRADPSTFAIARPGAGLVGGASDGRGAGLLADVAAGASTAAVREAVARIGVASGEAARDADRSGAFLGEVENRLAASGGVNLDEELSNLILYQRAYGANARVLTAVDELWRTLLSAF